ncbi:DUF1772 domain-containing protein [Rhodobacterales bacterium HKCCE2091]|nr:DUF1772 domain-containing protein [Rhodobacterales bacterium HKCCE2091]
MTRAVALVALLLTAAIFGFFYAWACSAMWGLDAADPRVAIAAMQAMNGAVRNAVFFPAFFLTPVALFAAAALARGSAGVAFGIGGAVYLGLGLVLTMAVNVPMNEALAAVAVPEDAGAAAEAWAAFSPRWQVFNWIRTGASGIAVLAAGIGLTLLPRRV